MKKIRTITRDMFNGHEHKLFRQLQTNENTGCHEFTGFRNGGGYGQFSVRRGFQVLAHRAAYVIHSGESISTEDYICHNCPDGNGGFKDNPACCNPDHLLKRDASWNNQDAKNKGTATNVAKLTDEQVMEFRGRYAAGEGFVSLCKAFNISPRAAHDIAHGMRYKHLPVLSRPDDFVQTLGAKNPARLKGEDHGMSILTDEQVFEIRRIYHHSDLSVKAIAKQFNISVGAAHQIVQLRTWTHVPLPQGYQIRPRKLVREQVIMIKRRLNDGESPASIAKSYGLCDSTVRKIRLGKLWADVRFDQPLATAAD